MREPLSTTLFTVACASVVIVIALALWVTKSHFEARTYTELTGKEVTTWQALWVELRVIEPAKE